MGRVRGLGDRIVELVTMEVGAVEVAVEEVVVVVVVEEVVVVVMM